LKAWFVSLHYCMIPWWLTHCSHCLQSQLFILDLNTDRSPQYTVHTQISMRILTIVAKPQALRPIGCERTSDCSLRKPSMAKIIESSSSSYCDRTRCYCSLKCWLYQPVRSWWVYDRCMSRGCVGKLRPRCHVYSIRWMSADLRSSSVGKENLAPFRILAQRDLLRVIHVEATNYFISSP
jgi:hypothetical protein